MTPQTNNPSKKGKWLAAIAATALVLLLAGAAALLWLRGRLVWTDDDSIRIQDPQAHLRQVLWSAPAPIEAGLNTADQEYEPAAPNDGAELFFVRGLPGKGADLYVCARQGGRWSAPKALSQINTPHDELGPRLTADGRFLLFYSDRPGGLGQYDIWACPREGGGWGRPFNLGPSVNSPYNDYSPAPSPDGRRLYFASNRKAAQRQEGLAWRATIREAALGDYDLFACETQAAARASASQPATQPAAALAFSQAVELPGINTPYHDGACSVSPGGDFLYFASNRPGGQGGFDLFRCRLRNGQCAEVENLGPQVNTSANDTDPQCVLGGFTLYFSSDREGGRGGYDLYSALSREVYALREPRPVPQLGWSWYALLIALALMIPLLLWLRAVGYRHLSLLQKCLALSLLIHLLLTTIFSAIVLTQELVEYVAREAGMTVAVNLDISRQVEVNLQVRKQLTDLPVAQAAPAELKQIEMPVPARPQPMPMEINVPQAQVRPAAFTVQPEAPKIRPPQPVAAPALPQPEAAMIAAGPRIQVQAVQPVRVAEAAPQPRPAAPAAVDPTKIDVQPVRPADPDATRGMADKPLPPARIEPESAATLADLPQRAAPAPAAQAPPDLPSLTESVRVQLPSLSLQPTAPPADVPAAVSEIPAPRPLEARPISPTAASRPAELARSEPPAVTTELPRLSLVRDPLAGTPRPPSVDAPVEVPPQVAFITPISGPIGPGKLASPESLFQRSFEQRQKLIQEMGGSKESEEAVARALGFLARRQQSDGRWTSEVHPRGNKGGHRERPDMALTGLAALSFLASDHAPGKPGPYREVVTRAVDYLVSRMGADGDLRDGGDMYNQGIATLAVAEAAVMTGEARYRQAALKAADFILRAQNTQTGGWRYAPGDPGDTSVVGWQVMALHSVEALGLQIPPAARAGAIRWLDHASAPPLRVLAGYQNASPTPSMTAEAVFTRILLGQQFTPQQEQAIADYLLNNPPGKKENNYYYWYYATLALSQMRGPAWEKWNGLIQAYLRKIQTAGGQEDGSWSTDSVYGKRGGRIYTTAINALTLEVYYRYLPMYKKENAPRTTP